MKKSDITISRKDAEHIIGVLKKIIGLLNSWGRPGTARELEELISIVGGTQK